MHVFSEISMTPINHAFVHSFVFGQWGSDTGAIFEIDYFCSPYSSQLFGGPVSPIFFRVCRLFLRKSWLSDGSEVAQLRLPEGYKARRPKNHKLKTKQHWKPTPVKIKRRHCTACSETLEQQNFTILEDIPCTAKIRLSKV